MEHASGGAGANRRRRSWILAGTVLALSFAGTLLALEIGIRLQRGALFGLPTAARGSLRMIGARYPGAHDPLLGWVPEPGTSGRKNVWRTEVTITADGVRANGAESASNVTPILTVGDSFTFGDEVDDADTWPAQLERMVGRPVVNGGVFGYGLDQIVLRAEALLARFPADALVVSLIPNDVARCEYAYRYAWKPYFDIVDGALALRNTPVPEPHRGAPDESSAVRWLRRSFLVDFVMRRLDPYGWPVPESVRAHGQGEEVARLLVDRLADRAAAEDRTLLLVVEWVPGHSEEPLRRAIERAEQRGVPLLRMEPRLRRMLGADGVPLRHLFTIHAKAGTPRGPGHMTRAGNEVVAAAVASRLAELGVLADAQE